MGYAPGWDFSRHRSSLVRAPLQLTLRASEFGLSTAAEARSDRSGAAEPDREPPDFSEYRRGDPSEPDNGAHRRSRRRSPSPTSAAPPRSPTSLIPDHVDEEVVLVAEVAEEGAEDGAGAELHVEAPWDGYDGMTAADIRDRLAAASAVEAAAVELYESTGKNRRTVRAATRPPAPSAARRPPSWRAARSRRAC